MPADPTTSTLATMDDDGVLCLVAGDGTAQWLRPRPGAFDGVRSLDGAWLEHALADVEHAVTYQHGVDNVVDAVMSGAATAAVLIRPVSVAEIERTAREGAADAAEVDVLHAEAPDRSGGAQPRLMRRLRPARSSTRSAASCSAVAIRLRCRTGTTVSTTTSVRLCVAPPMRKNLRLTVPMTSTSAPTITTPSCAIVGSFHATGTDTAPGDRPTSWWLPRRTG